jgi:dCMP deaminase
MPKEVFRLSKREKSFLNLASKIAESSTMKKKHGAVVVRSGRVLAVGVNRFRNHPSQIETHRIKEDCSIHAEVDALNRCDPRGATLYVARINNRGEHRMSRPCPLCARVIKEAGIKKIVWSNS